MSASLALWATCVLLTGAPAVDPAAAPSGGALAYKGRLEGYRGLFPFHVFALRTPDFTDPAAVLGTATADADSGRFDVPLPPGTQAFYAFGQLDLGRQGPTLIGQLVFPIRKLPVTAAEVAGVRHVIDLGDMELAHVMREAGLLPALGVAVGLGGGLYLVGWVLARRLPRPTAPGGGWRLFHPAPGAAPTPSGAPEPFGRAAWALALGSTALLLPGFGAEPLALLEFTYVQEAFRPPSVAALLFDPISAELSHPPLWALILRTLGFVSRHEAWLRLPALLMHVPTVLLLVRVGRSVGGERVGLLAGALGGLLPVAFWYARDATPYAALALVSVLALDAARTERWRRFAITLIAGFFIHYTVAVLGLVLGFALFWEWRVTGDGARFRRALVAFAWVIPLPLAWSVHFIRTFLASGMSTRLMAVDYNPDPGFFAYVKHFATIVAGLPIELMALTPIVLGMVVVGGWLGLTRREVGAASVTRAAVLQALMVVGYVLFIHQMYMAFAGGRVYYAYRWTTVFVPGVVLAAAFALDALWRKRAWLGRGAAAIWLGGILVQDIRILSTPQRPAQDDAFAVLRSDARTGDAYCALPAVYFAQTMHYALFERAPADLLAMPSWSALPSGAQVYGPIHPVNTTVESVVQNLAFERVWVADYREEAFGTQEFDPATSEHHLSWLRRLLVADGEWHFPYLSLYRFVVPRRPEALWKDGRAALDFSKTFHHFRYFPQHLHTQQTGYVMSRPDVTVRLPLPAGGSERDLALILEVSAGRVLQPEELTVDGVSLSFAPTHAGGAWRGTVRVRGGQVDLQLRRGPSLTRDHRNTVLRAELLAPTVGAAPGGP